jgi:superfamily I DNA/RNA helicase
MESLTVLKESGLVRPNYKEILGLKYEPSEYQSAILDRFNRTNDNLIIQACAGSGKTTLLEMLAGLVPKGIDAIAVAFNKSIAEEFKNRLPAYVECKTLHGVGMSSCRKAFAGQNIQVDAKKYDKVIGKIVDAINVYEHVSKHRKDLPPRIKREYVVERFPMLARWKLPKAIGLIHANMVDAEDFRAILEVIEDYDIRLADDLVSLIPIVISEMRKEMTVLHFDDMLDHPLTHGYPLPQFDLVMVDEAQDLNPQQMELVSRIMKPSGRIIVVGDRYQAIYLFRGASRTSMDTLANRFNCVELPLSFCYRCGSDIVKQAQDVVGEEVIQSPPDQHIGSVVYRGPEYWDETLFSMTSSDLVICRTNAPLIKPCLTLIRYGQAATVMGGDLGKRLINLIDELQSKNKLEENNLIGFLNCLKEWEINEVDKALDKNKESLAEYFQDIAQTIRAFCQEDEITTVKQVKETINKIFSDSETGEVKFSSIHKSKGLQAKRVIYLGPENVPHPMALRSSAPGSIQQEHNLDYVAKTRAIDELIYQQLLPVNN